MKRLFPVLGLLFIIYGCQKKTFPGYSWIRNPVRPVAGEQTVIGKFIQNGTFLGTPSEYMTHISYDSIIKKTGFEIDTIGLKGKIGNQIEAQLGIAGERVRVLSVDSVIFHVAKDYSKFSLREGSTIVVSAAIVVKKFTLQASDSGSLRASLPNIVKNVPEAKVSINGNRLDVRSGEGLIVAVQALNVVSKKSGEVEGWVKGAREFGDMFFKDSNYVRIKNLSTEQNSISDTALFSSCLGIEFTSGTFLENGIRKMNTVVFCPSEGTTHNLDGSLSMWGSMPDDKYVLNIPTRTLGIHSPPQDIVIYEVVVPRYDVSFAQLKSREGKTLQRLSDTTSVFVKLIGKQYKYKLVKSREF